jgi:hypothetical protein
MDKYSLERIEQVKGKQAFDKLVVNGVAPFDEFVKDLEEIYRSELRTMYAYMNRVANLHALPKEKYHPYNDGKDGFREYELKTKHLRVYLIEKPGGKIVVLGGMKANQRKDQNEFRRLKKGYINSL